MVSSTALPSVNRLRLPKQGSAQVEVMEGTGSDKMCREEGEREGEAESGRPRQIPSHANHNNKRNDTKWTMASGKWSTTWINSCKILGTIQGIKKFGSNPGEQVNLSRVSETKTDKLTQNFSFELPVVLIST